MYRFLKNILTFIVLMTFFIIPAWSQNSMSPSLSHYDTLMLLVRVYHAEQQLPADFDQKTRAEAYQYLKAIIKDVSVNSLESFSAEDDLTMDQLAQVIFDQAPLQPDIGSGAWYSLKEIKDILEKGGLKKGQVIRREEMLESLRLFSIGKDIAVGYHVSVAAIPVAFVSSVTSEQSRISGNADVVKGGAQRQEILNKIIVQEKAAAAEVARLVAEKAAIEAAIIAAEKAAIEAARIAVEKAAAEVARIAAEKVAVELRAKQVGDLKGIWSNTNKFYNNYISNRTDVSFLESYHAIRKHEYENNIALQYEMYNDAALVQSEILDAKKDYRSRVFGLDVDQKNNEIFHLESQDNALGSIGGMITHGIDWRVDQFFEDLERIIAIAPGQYERYEVFVETMGDLLHSIKVEDRESIEELLNTFSKIRAVPREHVVSMINDLGEQNLESVQSALNDSTRSDRERKYLESDVSKIRLRKAKGLFFLPWNAIKNENIEELDQDIYFDILAHPEFKTEKGHTRYATWGSWARPDSSRPLFWVDGTGTSDADFLEVKRSNLGHAYYKGALHGYFKSWMGNSFDVEGLSELMIDFKSQEVTGGFVLENKEESFKLEGSYGRMALTNNFYRLTRVEGYNMYGQAEFASYGPSAEDMGVHIEVEFSVGGHGGSVEASGVMQKWDAVVGDNSVIPASDRSKVVYDKFDFAQWGEWKNEIEEAPVYWIEGQKVTPDQYARLTGSASYQGDLRGHFKGDASSFAVQGSQNVTVDFDQNFMSMDFQVANHAQKFQVSQSGILGQITGGQLSAVIQGGSYSGQLMGPNGEHLASHIQMDINSAAHQGHMTVVGLAHKS